jgi:hypothetical protein
VIVNALQFGACRSASSAIITCSNVNPILRRVFLRCTGASTLWGSKPGSTQSSIKLSAAKCPLSTSLRCFSPNLCGFYSDSSMLHGSLLTCRRGFTDAFLTPRALIAGHRLASAFGSGKHCSPRPTKCSIHASSVVTKTAATSSASLCHRPDIDRLCTIAYHSL